MRFPALTYAGCRIARSSGYWPARVITASECQCSFEQVSCPDSGSRQCAYELLPNGRALLTNSTFVVENWYRC